MFILPKKVIKAVEQKLSSVLCNGSNTSASRAKVNWDMVCKPRDEGGLGLRKLEQWNKAAIWASIGAYLHRWAPYGRFRSKETAFG